MLGARPKFIKPGEETLYPTKNKDGGVETLVNPNIDSALGIDSDSKSNFVYNRYHHLPLDTQRQKLPVFQYRNHILYLLEKYQTLVLIGETGCGKSTQVPQIVCNIISIMPTYVAYVRYILSKILAADAKIEDWMKVTGFCKLFLLIVIQIVMWVIFLELVANVEDEFHSSIIDKRLNTTDETVRAQLSRLLSHVRRRPLKFSLWRVVPLNSAFLIGVVSLTFTYTVAVVQLARVPNQIDRNEIVVIQF